MKENPIVETGPGYVIELRKDGDLALDCTGSWSEAAAEVLRTGRVDGLTLSYTSGFAEQALDFIEDWPIKWLILLDRQVGDVTPVQRLAGRLDGLLLAAGPKSRLDLSGFGHLRWLDTHWAHLSGRLPSGLTHLTVWTYQPSDLASIFHEASEIHA